MGDHLAVEFHFLYLFILLLNYTFPGCLRSVVPSLSPPLELRCLPTTNIGTTFS